MRVRDRVALALRLRLQRLEPYLHVWPQALATMVQPRNVGAGADSLAALVDEMWHHAGDTSTDINWYTKRGILAGVYSASELYMLTDGSPEFADTWDFVDRSLDGVLAMGRRGREALSFLGSCSVLAQEVMRRGPGAAAARQGGGGEGRVV